MNKKEEIIRYYCNVANANFISPLELTNLEEIPKKYNITKDDFVKIISENIYGAIFIGLEIWKPRFEFTEEEFKEVLERENFKVDVWRNLSKLPKTFQDQICNKVRTNEIQKWEELDCAIRSCILLDDICNYIVKRKRV